MNKLANKIQKNIFLIIINNKMKTINKIIVNYFQNKIMN